MRLSIRSFNIPHLAAPPPPENPFGILTFEDWFFQTPVAFPQGGGGGKNYIKIPYPSAGFDSYLSIFFSFFVRGSIIVRDFLLINQDLKSRL